jgi:perosamine synthetase
VVRPSYGLGDLLSVFRPGALSGAEDRFKAALREFTGLEYITLLPYARIGLYCLLHSPDTAQRDVLVSSYTCVVVPQEVLESGNRPRFFEPDDRGVASPGQHGVCEIEIVTHMFGREVDIGRISNRPRLLIEDACLSWSPASGKSRGDAVLFSLNLSKQLTTLWGGVLATGDAALHARVEKTWASLRHKPPLLELITFLRLLMASALYTKPGYTLAHLVKRVTGLGNAPTYSLDAVERPANAFAPLSRLQCELGFRQLRRLPVTTRRRHELAQLYRSELQDIPGIELQADGEIENPSHVLIRCERAAELRRELYALGINTGNPIDYTCAQLPMFAGAPGTSADYSRSARLARDTIALPFYVQLGDEDVRRISSSVRAAWRRVCQS